MERIILALKKVEEEADAIESDTKRIAAEILRRAEEEARKMEKEIEEEAQREGERVFSEKIKEAKGKAAEIKSKTGKEGENIKRKAESNLERGVEEIVKVTVDLFKEIE